MLVTDNAYKKKYDGICKFDSVITKPLWLLISNGLTAYDIASLHGWEATSLFVKMPAFAS